MFADEPGCLDEDPGRGHQLRRLALFSGQALRQPGGRMAERKYRGHDLCRCNLRSGAVAGRDRTCVQSRRQIPRYLPDPQTGGAVCFHLSDPQMAGGAVKAAASQTLQWPPGMRILPP